MSRSRSRSSSRSAPSERSHTPSKPENFGSNTEFQAKMARVQGSSDGGSLVVLTSPMFEAMGDGDMGWANEVQALEVEHELLGDVFVTRKYGESAVEAHAPTDGVDQVKLAFQANKFFTVRPA